MLKICTKCGELLPITDFYKDKYTGDGLTCWCKWCKHRYATSAAGQKAMRKANCSEAHRRAVQRYNKTQKARKRYRRYVKSDHGRRVRHEYAQTKRGRAAARARDLARKARKANAADPSRPVSGAFIDSIKSQSRCAYCGKEAVQVTLDHVIPLAEGGKHIPENLAPACMYCNQSKSTSGVWTWLMRAHPERLSDVAEQAQLLTDE